MARYEHLPIYKAAMDLCVYLEHTVRNFSRYNKYTLGTELRNLSRSILLLIIKANSAGERRSPPPRAMHAEVLHLDNRPQGRAPTGESGREAVLRELTSRCDMLKTMLVLAKEVRAFESFKSFQHASSMAVILSKQSEGWLKSSRRSRNRPSSP